MTYEISAATRSLLAMLQLRGLGAAKAREIARVARATGDPNLRQVCTALFPRLPSPSAAEEKTALNTADRILDQCHTHEVAVLSLCDDAYPERLRGIEEAPPLLYVKGEITALSMPAVAVVGTRQASEHGLRAARIIAKFLISQNFCVVSGLALGIDAAAHEGAVEDRGVSVAVLAHGLDTVAPTSNRPLAKQLLDFGGALVSEHPPRVPPRPAEFVRRNRIQSGLSLCSIVVESGAVGGAIHQARFTRTQGRPLLVVSPKENGAGFNSAGAHYLIETLEAISISGTKDLAVILSRIRAAKGATSRDTPSQSAPLDLGDGGCPL